MSEHFHIEITTDSGEITTVTYAQPKEIATLRDELTGLLNSDVNRGVNFPQRTVKVGDTSIKLTRVRTPDPSPVSISMPPTSRVHLIGDMNYGLEAFRVAA